VTLIEDLEKVGYKVGVAHGSVEHEEAALEAAKQDASLPVVLERVERVASETVLHLDSVGKMPTTAEGRKELVSQITEQALNLITEATTEKVAFHERALSIAQEMPTVYVVQQFSPDGQLLVQTYLSVDDKTQQAIEEDQDAAEALLDAEAYAEREKQATEPPPGT